MRTKGISDELYSALVKAERAAQYAHNLSYKEKAPYGLRTSLGKAQSILMRHVVKHASRNQSS